jgi:hypothetical protein
LPRSSEIDSRADSLQAPPPRVVKLRRRKVILAFFDVAPDTSSRSRHMWSTAPAGVQSGGHDVKEAGL